MTETGTEVSLTSSAATKLKTLTETQPIVRLYVAGQTCCGYRYGLALEETTGPEDTVTNDDDVLLVVAEQHREVCSGAVVDYVQTAEGEGFTVRTPASAAGCSCGRQ